MLFLTSFLSIIKAENSSKAITAQPYSKRGITKYREKNKNTMDD